MSIVSNEKQTQQPSTVAQYDVVVVGAGPYGLTTAAHLRAKGLHVAVFGKTLELWRNRMPPGMFLRSHWWATSLSDPQGKYSIERFLNESSEHKACHPLPIDAFLDYSEWFQKHAVPDVDETYVTSIVRQDKRFVLTLEDGRVVRSPVVVMAIGVYYYANRPEEYSGLPTELVSHSFDHAGFDHFAGKKLAIIGGGQSAVENAALLSEAGATVELVSRSPIHWLSRDRSYERTWLDKIKAPDATIAAGWNNWFLDHLPYAFYRFPQERKDRIFRNYYNAAASDWLQPRVFGKVNVREGQKVTQMQAAGNGVEVVLSNGDVLTVDHVMLATGYLVNVNNLNMIHPSLLAQVRRDEKNSPVLNHYFESNVSGLYFTGLSTVPCFGPLYRFVGGNGMSARRITHAIVRRSARAGK